MKKLLILLFLLSSIMVFSQDFDIETVKEIQAERELAKWLESMLYPLVGETIVITNLTLDYPASRLEVYGSMLDKEKSLPGLPIAKSKSVMPTMIDDQETYPTIVAKKEITIYLQKTVTDDILNFVQQNVALWMNINPEKGDILKIRNLVDFAGGIAEKAIEKKVDNMLFIYIGIALVILILVSVFILRSGFTKLTKSRQSINVTGFEKALQIKRSMAAQTAGSSSGGGAGGFNTDKKNPIPIQLIDEKKESDPFDFSFLEELTIPSFNKLIDGESAADLAFILTNLNTGFVSKFLNSYLGETDQIIKFMLEENTKTKNQIIELKNRLLVKCNKMSDTEKLDINSIDVLVNVMNQLDQDNTKRYLDKINKIDEDMGQKLRQRVFLFSDINNLNEYEIETIVLETGHDMMVKFLKSVERDIQEKFLENLTPRAASILREDMNYYAQLDQDEKERVKLEMLINIRKILKFIKE